MDLTLSLLQPMAIIVGVAGWVLRVAPRMEGRARAVMNVLIGVLALFTAVQGFGVGGIGATIPGWEVVGQLSKIVFYAVPLVMLLTQYLRRERVSTGAWGGLIVYGLALALAGQYATVPRYTETLMWPAVLGLTGMLAMQYVDRLKLLRVSRMALVLICAGSLVYLLVAPELAASNPDAAIYDPGYAPTDYRDSIIGLAVRLHGLTPHPNVLGYLAGLVLLLGFYPGLRLRYERLWMGAALAALILSQSKTVWIAVLIAVAVRAMTRLNHMRRLRQAFTLAGLVTAIGVGVAGTTLFAPAVDPMDITLTGRTAVWNITLNEFRTNLLAGYGPDLWDETYRGLQALPWVGQSHNQVVQTLGQAGLIGGLALAFLLFGLVRAAWVSRIVTNGASIALLVLLLLRCNAETPLRFNLDAGALAAFVIYLVVTTPAVAETAVSVHQGSQILSSSSST